MKEKTVITTPLSAADVTALLTGGPSSLQCFSVCSPYTGYILLSCFALPVPCRSCMYQAVQLDLPLCLAIYSSFTQLLSEPSADDSAIREVSFFFFFVPDVYSREFIEVDQSNRAPVGNTLKRVVPLLVEAICGPWSPSKLAMAVLRQIAQPGEFRLPWITVFHPELGPPESRRCCEPLCGFPVRPPAPTAGPQPLLSSPSSG